MRLRPAPTDSTAEATQNGISDFKLGGQGMPRLEHFVARITARKRWRAAALHKVVAGSFGFASSFGKGDA